MAGGGFSTRIFERQCVHDVTIPKYFIQSTNDEFGPLDEFQIFYDTVPQPEQLTWIPAADHFLRMGWMSLSGRWNGWGRISSMFRRSQAFEYRPAR